MSTALVMLMLPGLALFYGGLVRAKNVLSTIMHSFFGLAIVTRRLGHRRLQPRLRPVVGGLGIVGGFDFVFFNGVGMEPNEAFYGANGVPFVLFATFQMMFAAITPALISGAFAERKRFGAFVLFTILWSILVYSPMAHMVWGGGCSSSWAPSTSRAARSSTSHQASPRSSWPWSWASAWPAITSSRMTCR